MARVRVVVTGTTVPKKRKSKSLKTKSRKTKKLNKK